MIHYTVAPATTDVTLYLFIPDASSSVGAGLTGLVFNSSGLVCYYVRPLAAAAALTLATQTVTGAHSDGGFVEVSSANMPGVYRLDLSDAVCASGVPSVLIMLKGAANMVPTLIEIKLGAEVPTAVQNADALLGRNLAGGSDGGRMVKQALRLLRNKREIAGGTLTVYQENDSTSDWTAAVTTAAGNPVSTVDPA